MDLLEHGDRLVWARVARGAVSRRRRHAGGARDARQPEAHRVPVEGAVVEAAPARGGGGGGCFEARACVDPGVFFVVVPVGGFGYDGEGLVEAVVSLGGGEVIVRVVRVAFVKELCPAHGAGVVEDRREALLPEYMPALDDAYRDLVIICV